ncbi:MAG: class I SAM-dependent rRNA methyltransferase [Planctomycetaceae bacterium]
MRNRRPTSEKHPSGPVARRAGQRATAFELLTQRPLAVPGELPSVRLRSVRAHPFLFRKLIGRADDSARPGDLVAVQTPQGEHFGFGLFNPRAEIVVRMLSHGAQPPGPDFWQHRLEQAVALRRDLLRLDTVTDACRVVHAEGDGLSGLIVDRYGDVLSAELFSLAMYQRSHALVVELSQILGTKHSVVRTAPQTHGQEGFVADPAVSPDCPRDVVIHEGGVRFRVRFEGGHKTGFFCDQRDNRLRLATLCKGRSVLDLCCYTGGFSIAASKSGQAREVTGVDLDESAIALAKENARLNQVPVNFVHADAFGYMRDMFRNSRQYEVVVLDPPKLIQNRREIDEGTRKHFDLNRLAMALVAPGGLLLTCSCSGLLAEDEFVRLVVNAARHSGRPTDDGTAVRGTSGRSIQLLARTGAAADHPVAGDCAETEYLKAIWARIV